MIKNLKQMTSKALEVHKLLHGYCDDILIVGDIRRNRNFIESIDIVCIPKKITIQTDLLNYGPVRTEGFVKTVNSFLGMRGDPLNGKYTQRVYENELLNIYMVDEVNFGYMVMFRTGPVGYVKNILHDSLPKAGLCSKDGYICVKETGDKVPIRKEEDLFTLIEDPWIIPVSRT